MCPERHCEHRRLGAPAHPRIEPDPAIRSWVLNPLLRRRLPGDDQRLADRAALLTRARKRDVDEDALRDVWLRRAAGLGFSANAVPQESPIQANLDSFNLRDGVAEGSVFRAVDHLSERTAVSSRADLLAATLGLDPGAVSADGTEKAIGRMEARGGLHAARGKGHGRHWTTDAAVARESETIALMKAGQGAGRTVMKHWVAETRLHRGRPNDGRKEVLKAILATRDRKLVPRGLTHVEVATR